MILYVLNKRKLLFCLLVLASSIFITFFLSGIREYGSADVFTAQRDIPIYSVDVPDNRVSITFDCAWGADDIPEILDTLKEAQVKATFFIVGQWAEKYPETVKMIAQDGHDIANHSYSHFRMSALGRDKMRSEIRQCGEVLEKLSGVHCELFRAPYGDYNNELLSEAKKLGYYMIQWDVDSLDWKPEISREEILRRIRSKVRKGSIILFHNDTFHTAKLLPGIIGELKGKGFDLVPVSELILRENYHIDHEGRQKINT